MRRVLLSVSSRSDGVEAGTTEIDQSDVSRRALLSAVRDQALVSLSKDAAHDLRGMLNIVSMSVELLARAAEAATDGIGWGLTPRRSADIARRELKRIDRLFDALVGARPNGVTEPQTVDIVELGRMLIALVGPRASRQGVAITLETNGALQIRGFPDRLHGAILCLMINALDAMPGGGTLDLVLNRQVRGCRIELTDTGTGIAADAVEDIWSPGYTTKTSRPGLGLYVARSIVEAHGGTVRYEPKPEGGSCFVVHLPSTSQY